MKHGRRAISVPEEPVIVGYDNSPVTALLLINLGTVDQDGPELGACGCHPPVAAGAPTT